MTGKPTLRRVQPAAAAEDAASAARQRRETAPERPSWLMIALTVVLGIAVVLLIWSRVRLAERIEGLEAQIVELRGEVAARDVVIEAQRDRLGEVRRRVDSLREVLEEPLPTVD